jgi:hypothetical protein
MKPDFEMMSKAELRTYVLENRNDREAFEALADRIYANPNPQWYEPEDVDRIVDLIQSQQTEKSIDRE